MRYNNIFYWRPRDFFYSTHTLMLDYCISYCMENSILIKTTSSVSSHLDLTEPLVLRKKALS